MSMMADGEKSHSKSSGLSSKFQRMYKSPSNPPWKEAYRKVLFIVFNFLYCKSLSVIV